MNRDMGKVGVGALAGALAVVGVYEGRVRISRASEHVDLRAGEAGRVDGRGARRLSNEEREAAEALARDAREAAESPFAEANKNLAENVQSLGRRLTSLEEQKSGLQKQLEEAQERLARAGDGGAARARSDFDLSKDDWAELAKSGTIKYAVPCVRPGGWTPSPDTLHRLGLTPDDAAAIHQSYKRSQDRNWAQIKPLCVRYLGSPEAAEKLGADTCTHLILDLAHTEDNSSASEAMRQVAEIRAGQRPEPAVGDAVHPVEQLFLTLTGEMNQFEADLALSFGPEEAHRLAYAKDMCAGHSSFGGPGPRDP